MGFTTHFNCKQIEKHNFHMLLNTQSNYRLKTNKQGVLNKDFLGGFFQKLNKFEGYVYAGHKSMLLQNS